MTPDVNLLLAASRSDHPQHISARSWLATTLSTAGTNFEFTLMPMVVASFLRLVTSPRIFNLPTKIDEAVRFVDILLEHPGGRMASLGPEWPTMRKLCLDKQLARNDIPDAWLAAATLHSGEQLVTFDADLKKLLPHSRLTVLTGTIN